MQSPEFGSVPRHLGPALRSATDLLRDLTRDKHSTSHAEHVFQRLFKATVEERGCSIWAQWEKLAPELSQWWIYWEAGEPRPPQPGCQVSMRTQECLQLCWCSLEVRTASACVCCWELLKQSYSLEGWMYSSPQENFPNQMPVTDKFCRQCARDTLKPASCMDINISINRLVGKSGDWSTFAGGC